jgi:hypothetical protein
MNERHEPDEGHLIAVNCYTCTAGCVHLEYGNLMLTFTPQQFLALSEVIGKVRQQLLMENESANDEVSLVM